jgi:hypothetical protein
MTYIILSILIYINFIFVHIKKHGKIFAFILLLFMWILFWANTKNPDYFNYVELYNSIQYGAPVFGEGDVEVGYRLLMKLGVVIGLNYELFLSILIFFSYLLIHITVKKFNFNYNYVYLLYLFFPFFLDVVQIRNFLATSIFIFSAKYLYENTVKSRVIYVILIIAASTIHFSSILYLPMLLINLRRKNRRVQAIAIFSILSSIIVLLNNKQIPYINEIVSLMSSNDRVFDYLELHTNWGFLLYWFIQIVSFLMMFYSRKLIRKNINSVIHTENANSIEKAVLFVELVYMINLIAFIYLPLYTIASTFTRLMRNILILNYISFAIVNGLLKRRDQRIMFNILVFIYVLFRFLVELYLPYTENIMDTILRNNLIIG